MAGYISVDITDSTGSSDPAKRLLRQYNRLKADRSNFDSLFQEVADYVLPRKSNIIIQRARGTKQTEKLFDSTALHANQLLASSMQSTLTSAATKWFQLKARDMDLREDKEVLEWLEEVSNLLFFELQISNFEAETHELYLDLGAFGTSCMLIEEDVPKVGKRFGGLLFKTFDISDYVISENASGYVDTVYRVVRMEARQAVEKFGAEILGEKIRKAADESPYNEYDFLHVVFKRSERDAKKLTTRNMEYASIWISICDKKIVAESGYEEFPYVAPRWEKTSGEKYGRSPAMTALPDIKTLNKAIELGLKTWAKLLDPPLEALDDGIIGSIRTAPGGITHVRELGSLKPLESGARLDISFTKEESLKRAIEKEFFVDLLQLPPIQGTPMTATEVERRIEQMHRVLSPVVGRLRAEFLSPMIDRCFAIMYRAGAFPAPPSSVVEKQKESAQEFDVEFLGPLARAQKASDIVAQNRWLESIFAIAQAQPQILDNIDGDFIAQNNAVLLGVPTGAVNSKEKVAGLREARSQQIREAQERQDEMMESEQAKNSAPFIKAVSGGNGTRR